MKQFKLYAPSVVFLVIVFVLAVLFFTTPKQTISVNEKRPLATLPEVTADSFMDGSLMTDFEEYLSDHFPARDLFVGVNAYYKLLSGRGMAEDVYFGKDGYLIGAEGDYTAQSVQTNIRNYAKFADVAGLNATVMIVPSTGYIMDDKLPAVHTAYNDDAYFDTIKEQLGGMSLIDLREPFKAQKNDTQLYYKTDHHLTAAGSFAMYKAFLETQDITPNEDYRIETYDGFYGTMYTSSGYWLSAPDTVELWYNDALSVSVEISNGKDEPTVYDSVFFKDQLENPDKYPVYLNGNNGLVKITNPAADGGKLLIVKDSFAHCFTGFLAQHYSEIYMVDLRYYSDSAASTVAELVSENGIEDVLYLYGMENLATDSASSFRLFYGIEDQAF